jgi:hypothetical protein
MVVFRKILMALPLLGLGINNTYAGPYAQATGDAANAFDPGVPGFIGPDGAGVVSVNNVRNPLFVAWATSWTNYLPALNVDAAWSDPQQALGPVTADHFDIVSLGDVPSAAATNGVAPGQITLGFDVEITNNPGPDFAIFENTFDLALDDVFAELAYVEVSTDGLQFARFPSVSLGTNLIPFVVGTIDPTEVYNLAGKHANYDEATSWGTPFDLQDLSRHAAVINGSVDLDRIRYVRLVDIPGSGNHLDTADPAHPIYDVWPTEGSAGFDLEAIGVIHARTELLPPDHTHPNALSFMATTNRIYQIECATSLAPADWTAIGPAIPGDNALHQQSLPAAAGEKAYYRIKITP